MAKKLKTIKVAVGPTKAWEKLYVLRETTRTTGMLIELQVTQLRAWPMAFLNVADSTCEFDFDGKRVIYNLTESKDKRPKDFKGRLRLLAQATQQLLGDEYSILINSTGKKVHFEPQVEIL